MENKNYGHPCFGKDAASKIGRQARLEEYIFLLQKRVI